MTQQMQPHIGDDDMFIAQMPNENNIESNVSKVINTDSSNHQDDRIKTTHQHYPTKKDALNHLTEKELKSHIIQCNPTSYSILTLEYNTDFNYKYFFEFLFYHMLFFIFLGPLSSPIIMLLNGSPIVYNMAFMGLNVSLLTQLSIYLLFFISLFFYSLYTQDVYFTEILMMIVTMLMRIFVVANKYATFSDYEIVLLKRFRQTSQYLVSKQIFFWINQDETILTQQLTQCMKRNDFEEQLSYFTFLVRPTQQLKEKLETINAKIHNCLNKHQKYAQPISIHQIFNEYYQVKKLEHQPNFHSYAVIKYYVDQFNKKSKRRIKFSLIVFIVFFIAKSFAPSILRYYYKKTLLGSTAYDQVTVIFILILYLMFQILNSVIAIYGVVDVLRIYFLLVQCSHLIMPKKQHHKYYFRIKKLLPTINLFCPLNLTSWNILRRLCLEYGQIYIIRTQYLVSQGCIMILINIILYLFILFDVLYIDEIYIIILVIETLQKMLEILVFLILAAKINDFFMIHIELLNENRDIILDLIGLSDQYFGQNSSFEIQTFIHKIGKIEVEHRAKSLKIENTDYLQTLEKCYSNLILDLQTQFKEKPFRMFGLKVQSSLVNSLIIGFFSFIISLFYTFFLSDYIAKF